MVLTAATPVTFILARNRPQADAFYSDVLGLPMLMDDGFAGVFDLHGATLRITETPDHVAGPHPVLGWQVADIRASIRALNDHGVQMIIYDGLGQDELGIWTSPDGKAAVAFFHDPEANVLSLTQS